MSQININVHGATNILADMDACRREETQRRKLLRLAQVQPPHISEQLSHVFHNAQWRTFPFID